MKDNRSTLQAKVVDRNFNELDEDVVNDFYVNVSESEIAACVFECKLLVIEPELTTQRCMEIMNMNPVTYASEAELVRLAVSISIALV